MSRAPLGQRFHFNTICAGILRILQKPTEFNRLYKFLDEKYFFREDSTEQAQHLRSLIQASKLFFDESKNNISMLKIPAIMDRIRALHVDPEKSRAIVAQVQMWLTDGEIKSRMEDEDVFDTLVNYLKAMQFAKHSPELYENYQIGKIPEAIKCMENIVSHLNKIGEALSDDVDMSPDGIWKFLEESAATHKITLDRLYMGSNTQLDKAIGGFEKQTLNVFIAPTGGGKSLMCHHILRRAIDQQMRVHLFCVEDRYKSFIYKYIAAQTGLDIRIVKTMQFNSTEEKNMVKTAIKNLEKYIKVQFLYGHNIDTIHQLSLEYDTECRSKGVTPPIIHIVDYTGHIAGFSKGDKTHEKIRNAYAARKDFALKHHKICFDFAQINREGNKRLREEATITHADLAGAYDLSQVCDNIISINRNAQDMDAKTATLHISKARDGETCKFQIKTQFEKARFDMEIKDAEENKQLLQKHTHSDNVTVLRPGLSPII